MQSQSNQASSRIPELDGIRGLAIALVVFQHYVCDSITPGASRIGDFIKNNFTFGGTGVDLFFVLSGFLIGGILMDNRKSDNFFKSFYIRRACRILPLYFIVLASYALFSRLLAAHSQQPWFKWLFVSGVSWWTYATFTQSIFSTLLNGTAQTLAGWLAVTWSLAIEEQFYFIFPMVVRFTRPAWILPLCLAGIGIVPILYLVLWLYHPVFYYYLILILPVRADALLLGVACACLFRNEFFLAGFKENRGVLYIPFALLLLGAGFMANKFNSGGYEVARDLFFYTWMALLYAVLLLIALTDRRGILASFFRLSSLRNLGMIAYGVYLFHEPVNGLLHGLFLGKDHFLGGLPDNIATLAALLGTLTLASFSWRFFEKPIIAWGHSFLYSERTPQRGNDNPTTIQTREAQGSSPEI